MGGKWSSTKTEGIWWWCVTRKACGQGAEVLLVSSEEIGLSIGHPEESSINPVSRQSSAQLLNVLGVARLQGSFVKHPVLISWGGEGRAGSHSTWGLWRSQVEHAPPGRPDPHPKTMAGCLVTFEEDKLAILPLIGSVDGCGQAPPELADGHGVSIHHLVFPHAPEPTLLGGSSFSL